MKGSAFSASIKAINISYSCSIMHQSYWLLMQPWDYKTHDVVFVCVCVLNSPACNKQADVKIVVSVI